MPKEFKFYAHSANEKGKWHLLRDHLVQTAEIAAGFGRTPLERDLFRYAGLMHDAGKYPRAFQKYLEEGGRRGSVPHAKYGAALSYERSGQDAVAFAVLGHHQGLLDIGAVISSIKELRGSAELSNVERDFLLENCELRDLERRLTRNHKYQKHNDALSEFFIRYLFSVIIDADCLDTESHFVPEKTLKRSVLELNVDVCIDRLEAYFSKFDTRGDVNKLRNEVRDEAISHAGMPVGFFSLSANRSWQNSYLDLLGSKTC